MSSCVSIAKENTYQFRLVGLAGSIEFQKCLAYITRLHSAYPKIYSNPVIRGMLEYDWEEYLLKVRRKIGGKLWSLEKKAAVFINDNYLGSDDELVRYISGHYRMSLKRNYGDLARKNVLDLLQVYLDIGLYADLVPKTCKRFIKKCNKIKHGYTGTNVHRIMKASWIQAGGYELKEKSRTCENYVIPHNRRGVLSMCNDGRHTNNTTQFHISLNPTPWMDTKYVAFGQLIQGDSVLKQIEETESYYEFPNPQVIKIVKSGEYLLDFEQAQDPVVTKTREALDNFLQPTDFASNLHLMLLHTDECDPRDKPSQLFEFEYGQRCYCHIEDVINYLPLDNLPPYLIDEKNVCTKTDEFEDDMLLSNVEENITEEIKPVLPKYSKLMTNKEIVKEIIINNMLAFLNDDEPSLHALAHTIQSHVRFEGILADSIMGSGTTAATLLNERTDEVPEVLDHIITEQEVSAAAELANELNDEVPEVLDHKITEQEVSAAAELPNEIIDEVPEVLDHVEQEELKPDVIEEQVVEANVIEDVVVEPESTE